MTPAPPPAKKGSSDFLVWWLAPIMILIFGMGVWSNHFENQFHWDDFDTVANNRAIRSLSNIPRFFTTPRTFSTEPENADYRPLLITSFALDASLTRSNSPVVYQMDSSVWFGLLIFSLFFAFRLIPGTSNEVALFATALFGLHPVAAETVNYIVQRGQIMGGLGVSLALVFWMVWPRRLPPRLPLNLNRVPQSWWEGQIFQYGPGWARLYKSFLKLPIPFYLIPLVPALFAEPSAAVFALILIAYTSLFDPEAGYRRLLVPAIVCGGYWLLQTLLVWNVAPLFRIPFLSYWVSQPWVAMRYLYRFLAPATLSADAGFQPLHQFWPPLALLGLLGTGLLILAALVAGRRRRETPYALHWHGVAFGIWWFLTGLLPTALVPQRIVEANPRMFFASAGLALALAHLAGMGFDRIRAMDVGGFGRIAALSLFGTVTLGLLGTLGWMTWQRNQVWESELTLWQDVTEKHPENARGLIHYAAALAGTGEDDQSLKNLRKAVPLAEDDGQLQLGLARGFDRLNRDIDAEFHFRRALVLAPRYSAVYAYFGQWLLAHNRVPEAFELSSKALALNAADIVSRRTLMDIYSQRSDWAAVKRLAKETLALDPDDPAGKRSEVVAETSIDQVRQAEADVKTSPTVDDYLKLSVLYYHNQRYEDCVQAARNAVRLRPGLAEGYANMAAALHTMGRDDEAIAALREVIRLRPDMAFAKSDLEILLEKKAAEQKQPR